MINNRCSKVPSDLEDPIDDFIYNDLGLKSITFLRYLGFTPNMVTMASFISGLLAIYLFFYEQNIVFSITLYILSYVLDCWDGCMARKYQLFSKYGDLLDHITDLIINISIYLIIFFKFWEKDKFLGGGVGLLLIFGIFLTMRYVCCQQNYNNKDNMVNMLGDFCPYSSQKPNELITFMKYNRFGSGMFQVLIIPILMSLSVSSSASIFF